MISSCPVLYVLSLTSGDTCGIPTKNYISMSGKSHGFFTLSASCANHRSSRGAAKLTYWDISQSASVSLKSQSSGFSGNLPFWREFLWHKEVGFIWYFLIDIDGFFLICIDSLHKWLIHWYLLIFIVPSPSLGGFFHYVWESCAVCNTGLFFGFFWVPYHVGVVHK